MTVSAILLAAIILVESSFAPNVKTGHAGEVGPMQIRACVLHDVNEHYGTHYTKAQAKDRKTSIEIFKKYVDIYATKERLGREPTEKDIVRIWNGGPNGYREHSTLQYYAEIVQAKDEVSPEHIRMVVFD